MRYALVDSEGREVERGEVITRGIPVVVVFDGQAYVRDRKLESAQGPYSGNRVAYRRRSCVVLVGCPNAPVPPVLGGRGATRTCHTSRGA